MSGVCPISVYQWDDGYYQESWNQVLSYCDLIKRFADNTGLDPTLLATLIMMESGGDPEAYSSSGAVGLMQVMPRDGIASDFMCKNGPCFSNRPTIEELKDPAFNIEYGSNFLAGLVNKYGLREALFRYGPVNVGYTGYADKILELTERIKK